MLPELARGSKADQCLSPAIKTLAVSILARGSQGRAPMSDALAAHTTALESLNSGLDGWATSAPNIVAASIMCLFLSEMIMPTGSTSAIVHAKGIEDLMKLQKPCFYASGISHHLFVGFRPVLVLRAFFSRRKHFLSDPAWTSIPFEFYIPSPLQSLFTEVFPLAEILGRIDDLSDTPADQAVASAQQIVEELLNILQNLVRRDETVKEETTAHRWLPIFPAQEDLPIQFPDIIAGNFFTHLWAFQVICAHNIIRLTSRFPCLSTSTKRRGLDDLLDVKMINQLALWTFRSIEFLLKEEFKLFGAASISLPLKTACDVLKTFGADDPEMAFWFCRVSRFIKETGYYFLIQMLDADE
ncbi:Zn(2)-C6 fungal-type domain-containing protein [Fusarium keratoplasticum]|uniref:Zn(2)-C6 fungal-type domain-containing protein n=1 Tax=Fusarium keratoplasticum TaxID=1328300 RepID=A0ACC0RCE8_9HYPO|nr:Zn(2)-C6 fungal-type domain-containing protein [Fusarium keratoplasticum]KAI8680393.1 Zn(2)-C6 fungal-type domain-containing protein [Fusarium keratoplasticum]KAI8686458.1 Zn(2)-C6 fungal-type domain-containing protein [Fusarium keratoplasticum]